MRIDKKIIAFIFFGIIFIIPIILRFIAINADQPPEYLFGTSNYDEGIWAHSARNKILFGKWVMDEWNPLFINPTFTLTLYLFFYMFGVGVAQARLVNILFSIASLILLYKSLRLGYNKKIAMIGTFLLSYNILYFMFSRSALIEVFTMFFMILTFYFWIKASKKPVYFFLVSIALFLTFLAKSTTIMFIVGAIFCFILYLVSQRRNRNISNFKRSTFYFLSGLFLCTIFYLVFYFIPYFDNIIESNFPIFSQRLVGSNVGISIKYGITGIQSVLLSSAYRLILLGNLYSFLASMPIEAILFSVSFLAFLPNLMGNFKKESVKIDFFVFSWLITGILYFFIFDFPLRRMMLIIIPMIIFASKSFENITINLKPKNFLKRIVLLIVLFYMVYILFSNIIKYLFFSSIISFIPTFEGMLMKFAPSIFFFISKLQLLTKISLVASFFSFFVSLPIFIIINKKSIFRFNFKNYSTLILAAIFVIFLIQYLSWVTQLDYTAYSTSIELGEILPEKIKVQGTMASSVSLENKICSIPIMDINSDSNIDVLNRTDIKYIITYVYPKIGYGSPATAKLLQSYPNAKLIKQWRTSEKMQNQTTGVYEYAYIGLFDKYPGQNITKNNFYNVN